MNNELSPPGVPPVFLSKLYVTFMGIIIMSPVVTKAGFIPDTWADAKPTMVMIRATAPSTTIILLTIPESSFY
jgi:hypothetical protein